MKDLIEYKRGHDMEYKEHIMYVIIGLVIISSSIYLSVYLLLAPFKPAIVVQAIYTCYHIFLLFMLKKKFYMFVKLSVLITFICQLTLGVYFWFPVGTGYNLFYYMVPMASFLIMNIGNKYERTFAIFLSFLATALFLGSVYFDISFYIYDLKPDVLRFIHAVTVLSTIVPGTFIFYRYTVGLEQQHTELRILANTDALTQISNRRVLFEQGEQEVYLAKKYHHEFSLIELDIDYFKNVNDSYGHPVGDQTLIELSDLIRHHIRKEDTFSRHGGEEFAIIVRKTDRVTGLAFANKLREVISEHVFDINEHEINLTVSIGITQYESKYKSFDAMMLVADKALYEAKDQGRNQVIMK